MPSPFTVPPADREILRQLGGQLAKIASLPIHRQKADLWTALNDLRSVRPMLWIDEMPLDEMDVDGELEGHCGEPWCRDLEKSLRWRIYQWNHLAMDAIVGDFIPCPVSIHSTGFGIHQEGRLLQQGGGGVFSQHFDPQITCLEDVRKIRMPEVTVDWEETEARYEAMCGLFAGIMAVRKVGRQHYWFTPWDNLIRWYGVEQAMVDLVDRPEVVNAAVSRIVEACLCELDQLQRLNVLTPNHTNCRIGSGGYGYTTGLPAPGFDPGRVRPIDMWGCSNAQIFSEVSPEMHWEFALRHDLPWLSRWGLTYYGCCEPLHHKMGILRRVPNLRKVSINYRANLRRAAEELRGDYVFSYKPNPAWLAEDQFRLQEARRELETVLAVAGAAGCHVEVILKDISTVRGDPQRLWAWSRMAMEVCEG